MDRDGVLAPMKRFHWQLRTSVGPWRPGKLAPVPGNTAVQPTGCGAIGILPFLGLSFSIYKTVVVITIITAIHSSQGCYMYIVLTYTP